MRRFTASALTFVWLASAALAAAAPPHITTVTPQAAWDGANVTIVGTNFSALPGGNVVLVNGAVAAVVTESPTSVVVTVPARATSGPIELLADGIPADNAPVFFVSPPVGFADISAMNQDPSSGELWVADRFPNHRVSRLTINPDRTVTASVRATLNRPMGLARDPWNRFYISSGEPSSSNIGTVWRILPGGGLTLVRAAANTSNPIRQATALAWGRSMNPASEEVFFTDLIRGQVLLVPRTGPIIVMAQTFSFNNPAGAETDASGNLYFTSSTALYKLSCRE